MAKNTETQVLCKVTVICLADGLLVHASLVIQENNTFEERHRRRNPGYCTRFV